MSTCYCILGKKIILEYSSIPLFGSFNGGNGKSTSLFWNLSRREWNGYEGMLIPHCSPQNWEEWEGMNLGLMKFLLKPLNTPLISVILFSINCKKKNITTRYCLFATKVKLLLFRETPLKLLLFINIVTRYSLLQVLFTAHK